MQQMRDIENRQDIATVISNFYKKAMQDEIIGHYFTDVAQIDLEEHLPIMYNFWENLLFQSRNYQGGMMYKHVLLHQQAPLQSEHFERWLQLFEETVDTYFTGDVAEEAKQRAYSIANIMQRRLSNAPLL